MPCGASRYGWRRRAGNRKARLTPGGRTGGERTARLCGRLESTIVGNEATTFAKIVMIGCTDKVKSGDNGPLTNAFS